MDTFNDSHRPLREQRLQHQLELQKRQIERVLDDHRVPATIANDAVQPSSFLYELQTHLAAGWDLLRQLKREFMQALNVNQVQLETGRDGWRLQVARPYQPPVPLLDLMALLPAVPSITAILGLAEDGRPVFLNFRNPDAPHVLISGGMAAGKTVLLRTIASSLALTERQANLQLLILAPAIDTPSQQQLDTSLKPLNLLPHMLADVTHRMSDVRELLQFLVNEMEYRREQGSQRPRIVILVDKTATLLERGGQPVRTAVQQLAQRGGASGIHLVLSTRRPHAPVLSTLLRANIPLRIIGQMENPQAEVAATDSEAAFQAAYLLGRGDFVSLTEGVSQHFQAAYMGDYDLHMSLRRLHAGQPILLASSFDARVQLFPEDATEPATAQDEKNAHAAHSSQAEAGQVALNETERRENEDERRHVVVRRRHTADVRGEGTTRR